MDFSQKSFGDWCYLSWTTLCLKWIIHILHDSSKELQDLPLQKLCFPSRRHLFMWPLIRIFFYLAQTSGLRISMQFLRFLLPSLMSSGTKADLRKRFYTITNSTGFSPLGSLRSPEWIPSGPRCLLLFIFVNVFCNKFYNLCNVRSSDDSLSDRLARDYSFCILLINWHYRISGMCLSPDMFQGRFIIIIYFFY